MRYIALYIWWYICNIQTTSFVCRIWYFCCCLFPNTLAETFTTTGLGFLWFDWIIWYIIGWWFGFGLFLFRLRYCRTDCKHIRIFDIFSHLIQIHRHFYHQILVIELQFVKYVKHVHLINHKRLFSLQNVKYFSKISPDLPFCNVQVIWI